VNAEGHTLLMLAAASSCREVVALLLQHGADVHAGDAGGATALHHAALKGCSDAVALLVEHGAAVNATDVNEESALLCAAESGNTECVQLLLDAGADASIVASKGYTVLHAAASNEQHPQVLQLLLQSGAAVAYINSIASYCDCCRNATPLMWCKQPAHVKLLLAAGADVHLTTSTGNTCLHAAAAHKRPASVVCLLIKAGVNLHAMNSDRKTAAQVATDCGNTLTAALLTRAAAGQ
jgi:ankyrin repeat protein